MSFRNRMQLAGGAGLLQLSVPLLDARNEKQLAKDVKLAGGSWQRDHWRTILSCYNRSPWFEYYRDDLAVFYEKQYGFLFDLSLDACRWVERHLGSSTPIALNGKEEAGDDFRNFFRPATRLNWAGEAEMVGPYNQVFRERNGFIPGLSILDLLFCEGPAARKWLVS